MTGKRLALLMLLTLLFLFQDGCKKSLVRYQVVSIPGYGQSDYEDLLDAKDAAIKYNAICNLINSASSYATAINKGLAASSDKPLAPEDETAFSRAQEVRDAIIAALDDKDEDVRAASLIFLSEFADSLSHWPGRLLDAISSLETSDRRTQYEQLNALAVMGSGNTTIDPSLIDRYLKSRHWLVRSMTLVLLSETRSREHHERLVKDYHGADKIHDRLLILSVFADDHGPEVSAFVRSELSTVEDSRLQTYLAKILSGHESPEDIVSWLSANHQAIDRNILDNIIEGYAARLDKEKGIRFFSSLIESRQDGLLILLNNNNFFKHLYDTLEKTEYDVDLVAIEKKLLENEVTGDALHQYKTKVVREAFVESESERVGKETLKAYRPRILSLSESILQDMIVSLRESGLTNEEIEQLSEEYRKETTEFIDEIVNDD